MREIKRVRGDKRVKTILRFPKMTIHLPDGHRTQLPFPGTRAHSPADQVGDWQDDHLALDTLNLNMEST